MLQHDDTGLNYTLVRSAKRKRLALQVKAGSLFVRATPHCREAHIHAFIQQNKAWIQRQLQQQQLQLQQAKRNPVEDGVLLLDQIIPVQLLQAKKSSFVFEGGHLLLYSGSRVRPERRWYSYQQQIECWYQQQAHLWLEPRLQHWQQRMQLFCSSFYLKSWRRRWGCCSSTGKLGLNWHLIKAPDWVIDYVIVHELAHLQWMDHSTDFWQLVRSYYPDVEAARRWLRQHQLRLLT